MTKTATDIRKLQQEAAERITAIIELKLASEAVRKAIMKQRPLT